MMVLLNNDLEFGDLIYAADAEDLAILADFITDKGAGRIALSKDACERLDMASSNLTFSKEVRSLIVEEIQLFGGNSLANMFRGGAGVPYKEILCDVADHVKAPYNAKGSCADIEFAILMKVLEKSIEQMTAEQRAQLGEEFGINYTGGGPAATAALIAAIRMSGFGAYRLATIMANAIVRALLGRGLTLPANAVLMRSISALAGPLGWTLTAIWTAFDLASPAYRVTVPCVIQLAYMRQKAMSETCPQCRTLLVPSSKFCNQCGKAIEV